MLVDTVKRGEIIFPVKCPWRLGKSCKLTSSPNAKAGWVMEGQKRCPPWWMSVPLLSSSVVCLHPHFKFFREGTLFSYISSPLFELFYRLERDVPKEGPCPGPGCFCSDCRESLCKDHEHPSSGLQPEKVSAELRLWQAPRTNPAEGGLPPLLLFNLCHVSFVTPWTVACQAPLSMDSPGKNTGVGCHSLLQGWGQTPHSGRGSNLRVFHCWHRLHCRQILYPVKPKLNNH